MVARRLTSKEEKKREKEAGRGVQSERVGVTKTWPSREDAHTTDRRTLQLLRRPTVHIIEYFPDCLCCQLVAPHLYQLPEISWAFDRRNNAQEQYRHLTTYTYWYKVPDRGTLNIQQTDLWVRRNSLSTALIPGAAFIRCQKMRCSGYSCAVTAHC